MKIRLLLFFLLVCAAAAQTPNVTGVVNGASFAPGLSPGVLAAVIGTNFGTDRTALSVTAGGKAAYILVATNGQINIQIPVDLQPGATTLTVSRSGASSAPFNIMLAAYAPAIFATNGDARLFSSGPLTQVTRGDNVSLNAVGLGATNPSVPTGTAPPAGTVPACVAIPQMTLGNTPLTPSFCGLTGIGAYQLNFRIPDTVPAGKQPLVLTIGGISSPPVNVTIIGAPSISSAVNTASQDKAAPIAPGSMVTVFSQPLGSKDQATGFPGTALQGVSVTMNGIPAPVLSLLATGPAPQITVVVPAELPEQGNVQVVLATADGASPPFQVTMAAVSPGIFRRGYKNYGAVTLSGSPCEAPGILAAGNCGRPFKPGDSIQIHLTGLGKATPDGDPAGKPLATGQLAPTDGAVYATVVQPAVTIADLPAPVSSSTLVPGLVGEYLITATIPDGVPPGDEISLKVSAGGLTDSVSIAVSAP